jgi:hypothetical protein
MDDYEQQMMEDMMMNEQMADGYEDTEECLAPPPDEPAMACECANGSGFGLTGPNEMVCYTGPSGAGVPTTLKPGDRLIQESLGKCKGFRISVVPAGRVLPAAAKVLKTFAGTAGCVIDIVSTIEDFENFQIEECTRPDVASSKIEAYRKERDAAAKALADAEDKKAEIVRFINMYNGSEADSEFDEQGFTKWLGELRAINEVIEELELELMEFDEWLRYYDEMMAEYRACTTA